MCGDFIIQYQKIILVNTITNLIRKFLSIGKLSIMVAVRKMFKSASFGRFLNK